MSGVDIIGELLLAHDPLLAVVDEDSIKGGRLPDSTPLPALLLRTTSVIDRQPLKQGAVIFSIERVSVTVRAASYDEQRAVIRLVRAACAGKTGAVAGCTDVAVLTAGTGPDLAGPADSFEQTQDFRVASNAPANPKET